MGAETKTFMPSLKTMSYVMTRDVLGRNVWGARPLPFPSLLPLEVDPLNTARVSEEVL